MNLYGRISGFSRWMIVLMGIIILLCQKFLSSSCVNNEGMALLKLKERVVKDPYEALTSWKENSDESDPCSWYGVECADGNIVSLNLKDLCLVGTLPPELGHLMHLKAIILHKNSFAGFIPDEIGDLKELELLDLGYNNLRGPFSPHLSKTIPVLLLDNNGLACHESLELEEHLVLSEVEVDSRHMTSNFEEFPCKRQIALAEATTHRRSLLEMPRADPRALNLFRPPPLLESGTPAASGSSSSHPQAKPSSPPHKTPPESPSKSPPLSPFLASPPPPPPTSAQESPPASPTSAKPHNSVKRKAVIGLVAGGGFIVLASMLGILVWRCSKMHNVRPWATGLSGQLRKAFVSGVPKLKRSELVTACEDFSNVIGSSSIGIIYKGTLSDGVEIVVASLVTTSAKDWSRNLEVQFVKKIESLSKVNHKNFVSLIGYCEEDEPFTRMMVFEYAPNGTLFEHLHIQEAEHLDWSMRLRIAMGMAYCLDHMHQLNPPVLHPNLNSSSVNLTEDYAAKLSDFCFSNELAGSHRHPHGIDMLNASPVSPENNVYSFGIVLLEIITGRVPFSLETGSPEDWAVEFLTGELALRELVDPMLKSFDLGQLERLDQVVRTCCNPDSKNRPLMRDVASSLKEITGLSPDKAAPRFSPSWWAELEIMSGHTG